MSCPRCNNQRQECSCKKKTSTYKKSEHNCNESELYDWCGDTIPCNETSSDNECVVQIDAKEVFYKLKGDLYSNMSFLDIPKGADLDYILERFAYFIENFSYFNVTPNDYGATDLKTYMEALTLDVKLSKECCESKQQQINLLLLDIALIKSRLNSVENPQITDTRGLGFTVNSSLKSVIQILSNKP